MSEIIRIIILAVIQGITEFLPISSDGHLVVGNELLRMWQGNDVSTPGPTTLTTFLILHIGTLGSILTMYFPRIRRMLAEADLRLFASIVVASIPAAVVGFGFKDLFERLFDSPLAAGIGFLLTGSVLILSRTCRSKGYSERDVPWWSALVIGCCQASALLPGVSRSGTTIAGGMLCGMERGAAATFSFLIAIPAIGGAALLDCIKLFQPSQLGSMPWSNLLLGMVVSFAVGIAALRLLIHMLQTQRLHWFGYYCLLAGVATITWQVFLAG
jgi:undecaprenyl-diphosphatase